MEQIQVTIPRRMREALRGKYLNMLENKSMVDIEVDTGIPMDVQRHLKNSADFNISEAMWNHINQRLNNRAQ